MEEFKKKIEVLLQEYIDEAENQEGDAYWSNHGPLSSLVEDFGIFLQNVEIS